MGIVKINHKYLDYNLGRTSEEDSELIKRYKETIKSAEIFILGTFNPKTHNGSTFYYGRSTNQMWTILPRVFDEESLKNATVNEKLEFLMRHKIYMMDLINQVEVPKGQENNVQDDYIDDKVTQWNNVSKLIENNPNLKKVFLTRRSFDSIPNIRREVIEIERFCNQRNILFRTLFTPSLMNRTKTVDEKVELWRKKFESSDRNINDFIRENRNNNLYNNRRMRQYNGNTRLNQITREDIDRAIEQTRWGNNLNNYCYNPPRRGRHPEMFFRYSNGSFYSCKQVIDEIINEQTGWIRILGTPVVTVECIDRLRELGFDEIVNIRD